MKKIVPRTQGATTLLTDADIQLFSGLRIPPDLLASAGIARVTDQCAKESFGVRWLGDASGIVFPYQIDGEYKTCRIRRDFPEIVNGKVESKYLSPYGDRRHVYVLPGYEGLAADPNASLLLVEAEKSVLAVAAWAARVGSKILPVGIGGCNGWRCKTGKKLMPGGGYEDEKGILPELKAWARDGRAVGILLDSNCAVNPDVQAALTALKKRLEKQKANVMVFDLPVIEGVNGPDDFLGTYGDEAFTRLLEGPDQGSKDDPVITLSDSGNAELVARHFGPHAIYCREMDEWYLADKDERWSRDRTARIFEVTQEILYNRWLDQSKYPEDKAAFRWALESLKRPAISNCVKVFQFRQKLNVLPEQLDADPLLLGVQNGILNLTTGQLVKPRLDLLVTKCAAVEFVPGATCERWMEYLQRVQPQQENREFLQRLAGSLLTGLQPEQCFLFFLGEGGNGKSVFLRVFYDLLGPDYCFKARKQLLFLPDKRSGEHGAQPNDLADLIGKRLITSTEQVGKNWNLEFIKDYTGGEPQHGRQLYKRGMNFKAGGKLIVSANEEPTLSEFDEAVRRRFILMPWDVVIPKQERVTPMELYVSSLLRDGGASGILNWALDGLRDLLSHNWRLDPPEAALDATEEYIGNEDRIGRFFADWFENDSIRERLNTKQLRKYFVAWLGEPDKFVMSAHSFTKECRRVFGSRRCHIGNSNFYVVDDLRLSDRGRTEYEQRETDLFTGKES